MLSVLDPALKPKNERDAEDFQKSHPEQVEQWVVQQEKDRHVRNTHDLNLDRWEAYALFYGCLVENVMVLINGNLASYILKRISDDPIAANNIHNIAAQFAGVHIIKKYGSELIEIASKELSAKRSDYDSFRVENAAHLRRMGLPDPRHLERIRLLNAPAH